MPEFQAILFDFDGTLVDSEPVHYACWYDLLLAEGIELTWETYHSRFSGMAHFGLIEQFSNMRNPPVPMERMWEIYREKQRLYQSRSCDGGLLRPETRSLLRALQPHHRMAVVTSSARADVEVQLANAGVRDCFEVVVCRDDIKELKPSPECYLKAASLLGIQHALVLEDSEPGKAAALAAGFELLPVVKSTGVPALLIERLGNALLS